MDPHHKTITGRIRGTTQHPIVIQRLWTSFMDSILLQHDFTFYPCLFCQCFRKGTRCPVKDPRKDPGFTSSMIHAPKDILCNYGYINLYTHEIIYYTYVYMKYINKDTCGTKHVSSGKLCTSSKIYI